MHAVARLRVACRRLQRQIPKRLGTKFSRRAVGVAQRAVLLSLVPSVATDVLVLHKPLADAVGGEALPTLAGVLWTLGVMDATLLARAKARSDV